MWEDDWEEVGDFFEDEDYEDEETCPEGYTIDECCDCVIRVGIEYCDCCPFGKIPLCGKEQGEKCLERILTSNHGEG